jgi:cytochrome c553
MNKPMLLLLAACLGWSAQARAADVESGKQKSQVCAACHGADGNTPIGPDFPRLAGQYDDYLLRALRDYKSGARKNPIMAGQVANLKDQDLADLAAYFASLKSQLHTVR